MKIRMVVFGVMTCFALVAAENGLASKDLDAKRAESHEKMLRKTGGVVIKQGQGRILVVNCQDSVPNDEITERVKKIEYLLKLRCDVSYGTWSLSQAKPKDANVVIYVVNDKQLPMSLVAVEAHWGLVNVANLKAGDQFSKELTRVFSLTCGGGNSQMKASPMHSVSMPADLDDLQSDGFTADTVNTIIMNLKSIGVTPSYRMSYKKACEEGWAPAPTNAYQKAIWDGVHASPSSPIRIEFDPERGR